MKPVGIIDGVPCLVPEDTHALAFTGALHFEHLPQFQRLEPGMGQIEWDGDSRSPRRRKPFVSQITIRPQGDPVRGEGAPGFAKREAPVTLARRV